MIETSTLIYELDFRLNKVGTSVHQSIPIEDKIVALNNAQTKLIVDKVGPDSTYGLGLDGFKKKYEDLENLIYPHTPYPVVKDKVGKLNKYLLDLKPISPKYMFYIDSYFLCNKGNCKDRVVVTNRIKHADIHKALANTNTNPSFEYQESIVTTTDQFLEFYSDGTFNPTKGFVSYLRYPQEIDYIGYIHLDGVTLSQIVNCELKSYLADELINYAVIELGIATGNQNAVQGAQLENQNKK